MRSKALYIFVLFALLVGWRPLEAQQLRLSHLYSPVDLSFDLNQLYNYNSYEHNRWGAGLVLTVPIEHRSDSVRRLSELNSFRAQAYAAWGTRDHAWKYGARLGLNFPRQVFRTVFAAFDNDLERVGARDFQSYNIFLIASNSSYRSSHFSAVQRVYAGLEIDPNGPLVIDAQARLSRERLLFDADRLLFPCIDKADTLPWLHFLEFELLLKWDSHLMLSFLAGAPMPADADTYDLTPYARLLAQYSNTFLLKEGRLGKVRLYAQAGSTLNDHTRLARRFDLSGTGGSRFLFDNTLTTVAPNTFMADAFGQLTVRYESPRPLWDLTFSAPRPFLQATALWGALMSTNGAAEQYYDLLSGRPLTSAQVSNAEAAMALPLCAPNQGLLEPVVGLNNILQQQYLAVGLAVSGQLSPKNSFYHQGNFWDHLCVMFTVTVEIEE